VSDETRDVEKPLSATPGWDESVRDAAAWTRTWLNPSQLIDVSASPAMLAETRARGASGGSSRRTPRGSASHRNAAPDHGFGLSDPTMT
jgi:hypothetical protein